MTGHRVGIAVVVGVVAGRQEALIPIDAEDLITHAGEGARNAVIPRGDQEIRRIHRGVLIRRAIIVLKGVIAGQGHIQ